MSCTVELQIGLWCIRNQINKKRDPWPQTDWGALLYSHGYYYFSFISCQELLECFLDWPISPSPRTYETGAMLSLSPLCRHGALRLPRTLWLRMSEPRLDSGPSGSLLTITLQSSGSLFHSTLSSLRWRSMNFSFFCSPAPQIQYKCNKHGLTKSENSMGKKRA